MKHQATLRSFHQILFLFVLVHLAQAEIVDSGPWDGYDTQYSDAEANLIFTVNNGKVTFSDAKWLQRVESARILLVGQSESIYERKNVLLVNQIFSESDFHQLFPQADSLYTYESFLRAIAHYPRFCGEYNELFLSQSSSRNFESLEKVCRRELATLFAHIIFESGQADLDNQSSFLTGLSYRQQESCQSNSISNAECDYHDLSSTFKKFFKPSAEGQQYYGRGATQLRWSTVYGRFAKAYFQQDFQGENRLLDDPDRVENESDFLFLSALWHYMTPQSPKTSAHQLVTGFYEPSEKDIQNGIGSNFGSTIDAMTAGNPPQKDISECGNSNHPTAPAELRAQIYQSLLEFFQLDPETGLDCKNLPADGGPADGISFWTFGQPFMCEAVEEFSQFSLYNAEDYKRCICYFWAGGDTACKQKQEEKCDWQPSQDFIVENLLELRGGQTLTQYQFFSDLESHTFSQCIDHDLLDRSADFIAIELIQDNEELTATNEEFRSKYANVNDSQLGSSLQLENMFTALTLQQTTIQHGQALTLSFNGTEHAGNWTFRIRPCVDRTTEEFARLDCAPSQSIVKLQVVDLCQGLESSTFKECPDYVNPDPDKDPEPDPDDKQSETDDDDQLSTDSDEEAEGDSENQTEDANQQKDGQDSVDDENSAAQDSNYAPVLEDFGENNVIEILQGNKFTLDLASKVYDEDSQDIVQISCRLPDIMKPWVTYKDGVLELAPSSNTRPGPWRGLEVTLDDGTNETKYNLNVWVTAKIEEYGTEGQDQEREGEEADGQSDNSGNSSQASDEEVKADDEDKNANDDNSNQQNETNDSADEAEGGDEVENVENSEIAVLFEFQESEFDPATLWAMKELRERINQRQQQNPVETIEEKDTLPEPKAAIKSINQIGEVQIIFSEPMQLEQIFKDYSFQSELDNTNMQGRQLADSSGSNSSSSELENKNDQIDTQEIKQVDLDRFIYAYIKRGDDETSADRSSLTFSTLVMDYTSQSIDLKIEFDKPLSVSIGDKPDSLILAFRAANIFLSQQSNQPLKINTKIEAQIPKQFPSKASFEFAVVTGSTVQVAANTAFLSQFGVTICLAVSLKAMWNLMHTMQLVAFLRLLVTWPANFAVMLQSMHNAVTLENLINSLYDSLLGNFTNFVEKEDDKQKSEELKENAILYDNIWLSMGIFGILIAFLVFCLIFYCMLQLLALRFSCCNRLRAILRNKLFYSVWIRYMIESYLKTTHSCLCYLLISASFTGGMSSLSTIFRLALLIIFIGWPFYVTGFLIAKRSQLDSEEFQRKFISMYGGLKTEQTTSLLYTLVFCLRRLLVVCALLLLKEQTIWLVLAFNVTQSVYFWYMILVVPHEGDIDNKIEYFNEICLINMQYLMVFFVPGSLIEPNVQWDIGIVSMVLLALIFTVNLLTLFHLTVIKIRLWCRKRKARRLQVILMQQKLKLKRTLSKSLATQDTERNFNDARQTSEIVKDFSSSEVSQQILEIEDDSSSRILEQQAVKRIRERSSEVCEQKSQNIDSDKIDEDHDAEIEKGDCKQDFSIEQLSIESKIPVPKIPFREIAREQSHQQQSRNFALGTDAALNNYMETQIPDQKQYATRLSNVTIPEIQLTARQGIGFGFASNSLDQIDGALLRNESLENGSPQNSKTTRMSQVLIFQSSIDPNEHSSTTELDASHDTERQTSVRLNNQNEEESNVEKDRRDQKLFGSQANTDDLDAFSSEDQDQSGHYVQQTRYEIPTTVVSQGEQITPAQPQQLPKNAIRIFSSKVAPAPVEEVADLPPSGRQVPKLISMKKAQSALSNGKRPYARTFLSQSTPVTFAKSKRQHSSYLAKAADQVSSEELDRLKMYAQPLSRQSLSQMQKVRKQATAPTQKIAKQGSSHNIENSLVSKQLRQLSPQGTLQFSGHAILAVSRTDRIIVEDTTSSASFQNQKSEIFYPTLKQNKVGKQSKSTAKAPTLTQYSQESIKVQANLPPAEAASGQSPSLTHSNRRRDFSERGQAQRRDSQETQRGGKQRTGNNTRTASQEDISILQPIQLRNQEHGSYY